MPLHCVMAGHFITLHNTPSTCSCGSHFTVEHALSCPKGGYPSIRHNEIRDLTAHLLTEVCHNVAVEPHLQPLTGETLHGASSITQDGARLDVAADGFWRNRSERAFFDVRYSTLTPAQIRDPLWRLPIGDMKTVRRERMTRGSGKWNMEHLHH